MFISFSLVGRIPPKKNKRNIFIRTGKVFNLPSNDYVRWQKTQSVILNRYFKHYSIKTPVNPKNITFRFYMPDNRRADLTNKAESVMDLMVDCGTMLDDAWQITGPVYLIPMGIDKKNPRVEISIEI